MSSSLRADAHAAHMDAHLAASPERTIVPRGFMKSGFLLPTLEPTRDPTVSEPSSSHQQTQEQSRRIKADRHVLGPPLDGPVILNAS